jgi:adenine-specific DNA-methyltransferase
MTEESMAAQQEQKMRGGFNTPDQLARFLVNWAIRNPSDTALDPSSGDSIFLQEAIYQLQHFGADAQSAIGQVMGVEIDEPTARAARSRLTKLFGESPKIVNKGFFEVLPSLQAESLDAYFGNPPFLRHRNFFKAERELALKFMEEQGFGSSKLTNAWVPFLVAGIHLLKPKGRLAMVMPAELLQVSYAANIREYLLNKFGFIYVVSFNRLVFPEVQQEVVLLMGTKGEGKGMRLVEVRDGSELEGVSRRSPLPQVPIQNSKEKWTQYFLTDEQRSVMRKALTNPSIKKLGDVSSVDVGVVTGLNDYFVLTREQASRLDAGPHLVPVVTRTKNLQGATFSKADWEGNAANGQPAYLLSVNQLQDISEALRSYLKNGKTAKVDEGYKVSIRDPWYVVPSVWVPDAFLFRQIGNFARMTFNGAEATCTDTLHRVRFNNKKRGRTITATFHNSLTLAFGEVFGRSYGGGVLELMPTEAEKLPVPDVDNSNGLLSEVDKFLRDGLHEEAVALVDKRILQEELGFKASDIELFRTARNDLSRRRKTRKPIAQRA